MALVDLKGKVIFGNVPFLPRIPIDAKAHFVNEDVFPDPNGDKDPAIFVARRRADGSILLLGRSLREDYDLQETLLRALAIALLPTILLILAIGAWFAYRASQRFKRVHDAIVRIMNGDLDLRLPFAGEDDIGKIARAVNLMLDEIARLLDHLKSAGDNIAHDLRTPLAVARAKLERALDNESGTEQLRGGAGSRARPDREGVHDDLGNLAHIGRRTGSAREAVQGLRSCRSLRCNSLISMSRSPNRRA